MAKSAWLRRLRNGREQIPKSEVRGGGREELRRVRGQWRPGGDTPCPRSGAAAEWSYPMSEARGGGPEEPPHAGGQGRWLGGATQGAVVAWAQEGLEELSHVEGQEGRR